MIIVNELQLLIILAKSFLLDGLQDSEYLSATFLLNICLGKFGLTPGKHTQWSSFLIKLKKKGFCHGSFDGNLSNSIFTIAHI